MELSGCANVFDVDFLEWFHDDARYCGVDNVVKRSATRGHIREELFEVGLDVVVAEIALVSHYLAVWERQFQVLDGAGDAGWVGGSNSPVSAFFESELRGCEANAR